MVLNVSKNKLISIVILITILSSFLVCLKSIHKIYYIKSSKSYVITYIHNKKSKILRGSKVNLLLSGKDYSQIQYRNKIYIINNNNLTRNSDDLLLEKIKYVRTPVTLYKNKTSIDILSLIKKGEQLKIIGYDKIIKGKVNKYKVKYNNIEGFVYSKYLVDKKEPALKNYDEQGTYQIHNKRTNTLGGGSAANLDYYPYKKAFFNKNIMPKEVRALYLNATVLNKVDDYIALAKSININSFVVDIKDNTVPGYPSKVMQTYSITNYNYAVNSFTDYKNALKKIKNNGFYLIGRITTFKDNYYAIDHPENSILDQEGNRFNHDGSFWPSAFKREVWEFNVKLALEAIKEFKFNEIQFDYVRFPDRTRTVEMNHQINYQNQYNEEKAQAIQTFLMYAADEIHNIHTYVSADVFGESAHNYVTAYGQYWGAISNVVDVISPMSYPDHFNKLEYNFADPVWMQPYTLLNYWASTYVTKQQHLIPTPAKVRSWIQTYDVIKEPSVEYDANKISEQILALYQNGLNSGYMTWNAASNINKYKLVSEAFRKEYKNENN